MCHGAAHAASREDSFQSDEAGIIEPIFFLKVFVDHNTPHGEFFFPNQKLNLHPLQWN